MPLEIVDMVDEMTDLDGKMVDLMVTTNPSRYKDCVSYNKKGNKVL